MAQKYWLAENGTVRCLDEACPQECDMGCPIYLQTIALEFFQTDQFDKAASYLEKAVEIEPKFAEAWNNLAACYGQMENHQRAYECYLKSYELLAKPNPLFGMAVAMKNTGNYAQAIQYAKLYEKRFGLDERIKKVLSQATEEQEKKTKSTFVKKSRHGKYGLWESDGRFLFCSSDDKKPEVFVASDNRPVTTSYRRLADAMLEDLDTYGPKCDEYESVAKWQYDLVNDYVRMKTSEFADIVKKECFSEPDWTEAIDKQDPWTLFFRRALLDEEGIREWIDKCTHMQLNAVLHLYRAFKSIRIAQCIARVLEEFYEEDADEKLEIVIKWIVDHSEYSYIYALKIIKVFKLYYGIHLLEHGDLFDDAVEYEEDQFFVGKKVSEEMLIGRNYYLYEEGLRAKDQPKHYEPDDIALDCSSDDEDEEDEEENDEPEDDELGEYVPERCWIKRISALEDGQEAYFLIAVTVDNDFVITGVTCIHETVEQRGGGMFLFAPGLFGGASESEYEEMDSYPARVFDELSFLVTGRALKPGFSIIGKPIPQWMRDNDEYNTFAMQSG